MTFSQYVDATNDRRRPRATAYRITMTPREIADAMRRPFGAVTPRRPRGSSTPERRTLREREEQAETRRRLARHQADAEHDRLVQRLRRLR